MPISKYFGGHGPSVMRELKAKHGAEAGERIFYATANARRQAPTKRKMRKGTLLKGE